MRILYFSRGYTTHDRRFLVELAASPHEVCYLRLEREPSPYESRPVPPGIHLLDPLADGPLHSPADWIRLVPRLEAVIRDVAPDLVHAGPIPSCAFLTALIGFHPLLAMSWGSDVLVDAHRDEFWTWMTRYTLQRSDMLIADCAEVSQAAVRIADLSPRRIVQFPWGVDLDRFHPVEETLDRDSVIVISTRSWEPNYGVMHLLAGFAEARAKLPSLRLTLLGSGSQRPDIERFLIEHRLQEAVCLKGPVPAPDLPEFFRAADVYASCALSDGSSLSLLEAMASGLPALVTDRASNREWIADTTQGRLAPFGDVPAIAAALLELALAPPHVRRNMGARNRAVAEDRADWSRNAAKLMAAYRTLHGHPLAFRCDQKIIIRSAAPPEHLSHKEPTNL